MRLVRWLLVIPLAFAGVYAAVLLGFLLFRASDRLCRSLGFSEAHCTITWYPTAEIIVTSLCAAVALFLAVRLPSFVAPSSKRAVAIAGALVSLPIVVWVLVVLAFPLFFPGVFAVLAGVFANHRVYRQYAAASQPVVAPGVRQPASPSATRG